MSDSAKKFGPKLLSEKVLRRVDEIGKKQVDLAKAMGVDQSSVSRWFKSQQISFRKKEHIASAARFLGVSAKYLTDDSIPVGAEGGEEQGWKQEEAGEAGGQSGRGSVAAVVEGKIHDLHAAGWSEAEVITLLMLCEMLPPKDALRHLWPAATPTLSSPTINGQV